jgi:hypothetical protein
MPLDAGRGGALAKEPLDRVPVAAHARAGALALVYAMLTLLATPGLDMLDTRGLHKPSAREEMIRRHGPAIGNLGLAIFDLNRAAREPVVRAVEPVQRPFRISQSWSLYLDGPTQLMRMEVQVDGRPVYRSVDPTLTWAEPVWRYRRVRPMVETLVARADAPNRDGVARAIAARAQRDFPGVTRVDVVALWGPFPGDALTEHHRVTMTAPTWEPVVVVAPAPGEGT